MKGDGFKWLFTFALILVTLSWAFICLQVVSNSLLSPTSVDVLAAGGVSGLMGALLTWDTLIVQFWFRKHPSTIEKK